MQQRKGKKMESITITMGDEIIAHHTTEASLSSYGQPVWTILDDDPEPCVVTWSQGDNTQELDILGVIEGWLLCRQPDGIICGIIWTDGQYYANVLECTATGEVIRDIDNIDVESCNIRGTVMVDSGLGCVL